MYRAATSDLGAWLRREHRGVWEAYEASLAPPSPRTPRLLYARELQCTTDLELLVSVATTKTGEPYSIIELNAADPHARGKTGLVLSGYYDTKQKRLISRSQTSPRLVDAVKQAADTNIQPGAPEGWGSGWTTYGVRADLMPTTGRSQFTLRPASVKPSAFAVASDWWQRQQASEERGQDQLRQRGGLAATIPDLEPTERDRQLGE